MTQSSDEELVNVIYKMLNDENSHASEGHFHTATI